MPTRIKKCLGVPISAQLRVLDKFWGMSNYLETRQVAGRMFARWSHENFFRYLIQDYDFDKMISFGVETIDMEKTVVNPQYRKATYQLKKLKEKKQRIESKFYPLVEQAMDSKLEVLPRITDKQMQYKHMLDEYNQEENLLVMERKKNGRKTNNTGKC